jgi:ABC-type transport system involved in multi-copper enzyme maturation permease subunit
MFITLLAITFIISLIVSFIVVRVFANPIDKILQRIIADEISQAWLKYLKFAVYVVGVSSGVRIWELEKYITPPQARNGQIIELTRDRWILELYRTIVESLQGIAWLLLVFFVFALVAFVIVRVFELRRPKSEVKDSA